jgi:Family of unknown function (DUF6114)
MVGASEMLWSERAPLPVVAHIGIQGLAGYLIPAFILLCGVLLWSMPIAWFYYSLLSILLALASWITSNLGGFFIGMLIDVVGGALAFAWTTDADYGSSGWLRGNPRIGLHSWALGVTSRLRERAAPQSEGHGGFPGFSLLAWANLRYWLGQDENFCRRLSTTTETIVTSSVTADGGEIVRTRPLPPPDRRSHSFPGLSWAARNLTRPFLADFRHNRGQTARSKKTPRRMPKISKETSSLHFAPGQRLFVRLSQAPRKERPPAERADHVRGGQLPPAALGRARPRRIHRDR